MYTLNCLLLNYTKTACQRVVSSLNTGSFTSGSGLQRAVWSSSARSQGSLGASEPNTGPQSDKEKGSKEFSHYPPLPGQDTALRWGGKKFEELPIAHIKATYNNTHVQVTDSEGQSVVRTSCGTEGFKNARKSTPIAAQTAGIAAAAKATLKGVTFVRVSVKGLGPGRLSAIKGLSMGGLEVVSITDNTPVPHNGCRPRKARRI